MRYSASMVSAFCGGVYLMRVLYQVTRAIHSEGPSLEQGNQWWQNKYKNAGLAY